MDIHSRRTPATMLPPYLCSRRSTACATRSAPREWTSSTWGWGTRISPRPRQHRRDACAAAAGGPGQPQATRPTRAWTTSGQQRGGLVPTPLRGGAGAGKSEVITLIGSKEGIAHFPLAFVNPGEVVLVPSPAYPVYASSSTLLVGGKPVEMPLHQGERLFARPGGHRPGHDRGGQGDGGQLPQQPHRRGGRGRLLPEGWWPLPRSNNIIVVSDAAYTEMAFDGYPPHELHGDPWGQGGGHRVPQPVQDLQHDRLAFGVRGGQRRAGRPDLGQVKSQIDSGAFDAVQLAGIDRPGGGPELPGGHA